MAQPTQLENAALLKLTYGPTPADRDAFRALGPTAWLEDQLNPAKPEDPTVSATLANFKAINLSNAQLLNTFPYSARPGYASDELAQTTLYRRLYSKRQVFETLVEFLEDYVPVNVRTEPSKRISYDRDVIRANALGDFPTLVWQASVHPAMLRFLSGYDNTRQHPNENFGRELLELFTVTTDTPYTQTDVVNAARVFSGFRWDDTKQQLKPIPANHWQGPVTVLGWTDPNPGLNPNQISATANSLVKYLALRPETAAAFAKRMARRYVSDNPSSAIVSAMAAAYRASNGNIPSVVRAMLNHTDFANSLGSKLRRPAEFIVATLRILNVAPPGQINFGDPTKNDYFAGSSLQKLRFLAAAHGHAPFDWQYPNGFPDTEAAWTTLSAQMMRWNNAIMWANGTGGYTIPNYAALYSGVANDWNSIVDAGSLLLFGRTLSPVRKATLIAGAVQSDTLVRPGLTADQLFVEKCKAVTLLLMATEDWNRR